MIPRTGHVASYVRAVERLWSRHVDRPVVLSPKEWALVESWYERGIPLGIVEEAIEGSDRRRSRRPPRSLTYLAGAVEEAWDVVVEGRVADPAGGAEGSRERIDALSRWERVRDSEETSPALRDLLRELLADAARGVSAQELDRRLDRDLPSLVPRRTLIALRAPIESRIESCRNRMAPEVAEATVQRALRVQLRRQLGLPRLGGEVPAVSRADSGTEAAGPSRG